MDSFRHEAFFYAGRDELIERVGTFLREGADAGHAVLAVMSGPQIEALRPELNGHAEHVLFTDMDELGSNPARITPAWRELVDAHPGQSTRGVGEPICAGRSQAELVEC